ncbi:glycosyltransferase family 4 protein [Iodobacter ciconiae]|uniref:Glycosyltransferase n=1 Tax=Iodobacter ciconiae TaxID=2496266 RepID=A0A3S8ZTQ9_9NEIS|nr:glycosyltransferase family 4 protein [Iodobacter ciconiae]AZN36852.1 glycosyltransferase [Iodobacter ciconiae]
MHIGIIGPISFADITHLFPDVSEHVAREMQGSSLLISLIDELLNQGHRVSAFTTEPGLDPNGAAFVLTEYGDFSLYQVPLRRKGFRSDRGFRGRMLDLFALERHCLRTAIQASGVDVLHAHWTYEFAWAAQDSNLPVLITCHDAPWQILRLMPDLYRLGRLIMAHRVLMKAKSLSAVSPYIVEKINWMHRASMTIIPNPLPADLFKTVVVEKKEIIIGMIINNWSRRKNAAMGMAVLSELKKKRPEISMHLYGPGMGKEEAAWQWAKQHQCLDLFQFFGAQPYQGIKDAIKKFTILLHPSLEESFGMTLAEAMAVGVPIVAGKNSGAVPWVVGEAGILVDVQNGDEILGALICLLSNKEKYSHCVDAGRERAMNIFSARAIAEQYIEQYKEIMANQ